MPISDAAIIAAAIKETANPRPAGALSGVICALTAVTFIGEGMATGRGATTLVATNGDWDSIRSEEEEKAATKAAANEDSAVS
jgi:hypothetical protein